MVEITQENARAAASAAERLLRDQFLAEALDEMIASNTQAAIFDADRTARREARHQVRAITMLRANLRAVFETWQAAASIALAARANE